MPRKGTRKTREGSLGLVLTQTCFSPSSDQSLTGLVSTAVPKIKTMDQNLVTDAGQPFMMAVPYDAYPRADADWFFKETSLPVQNIDTSLDKTEYRLKSPTKEDQGRYKVQIKNKHGEAQAFINLDVIGEAGPDLL